MLIANLGPNSGLVTIVDMQNNNQFAGFYTVYYENQNTAVKLENIRRYYESRTDNNYVILYNEPPRYKLCGRYAGIQNNNVLIELPNSNIIEKEPSNVLDPVINNYYAPVNQGIVMQCMQAFNMIPNVSPAIAAPVVAPPAPVVANVAEGNNVPPVAQGNVNTDAYNEELDNYQGDDDDDDDNSSIASEATTVSEDVANEQVPRGGKTKNNRKNRRKHKTIKKNKKRKNKTIKKVKKNHRKTHKKK